MVPTFHFKYYVIEIPLTWNHQLRIWLLKRFQSFLRKLVENNSQANLEITGQPGAIFYPRFTILAPSVVYFTLYTVGPGICVKKVQVAPGLCIRI